MAFIAVAIGTSLLNAGTSLAGASMQADAQKQAAQTQADMFNRINQQEQPFIQSGTGATSKLNQLLGIGADNGGGGYGDLTHSFTPADFQANLDPGYNFALQTGAQATRNASTPGVGALSGPALKDLITFNQGMANTGYQNAFNRFTTQQNNIFGRLSGIAGLGQNAATQVGTAGTALGTGIGQAQAAAGASLGAGFSAAGSNLASGGNTLAGLAYLNGGAGPSQPGLSYAAPAGGGFDPAAGGNYGGGGLFAVGGD